MNFDWNIAKESLKGFGGKKIALKIPKTGLPFFDTLRLYGAMELYVGLREDIIITDRGHQWEINGKTRDESSKKTLNVLKQLRKGKLQKKDNGLVDMLCRAITGDEIYPYEDEIKNSSPLENPDSVLKDGVRGTAASTYRGLESGYGNTAKLPLSDAILALAGQKRIHEMGGIYFLPVFEGKIDLGKVVSPVHVWSSVPNPLLIKALVLLTLINSLFADKYENRLSAVVYNTNYGYNSKISFNHSGLISIDSTALKKAGREKGMSEITISRMFSVYRNLLRKAFRNNKYTDFFLPALKMAQWILSPVPKHLSSLITSQEKLYKEDGYYNTLFAKPKEVELKNLKTTKNLFDMTYPQNSIKTEDHEAVRKLAKAVASAIYYARQKPTQNKGEVSGKVWYDEVVMLRSAPTAKVFKERTLTLLEQGHKENAYVGTPHNQEDYDPSVLLKFMGDTDRHTFEIFRDLFRMYLIQESTWKKPEDSENQN